MTCNDLAAMTPKQQAWFFAALSWRVGKTNLHSLVQFVYVLSIVSYMIIESKYVNINNNAGFLSIISCDILRLHLKTSEENIKQ